MNVVTLARKREVGEPRERSQPSPTWNSLQSELKSELKYFGHNLSRSGLRDPLSWRRGRERARHLKSLLVGADVDLAIRDDAWIAGVVQNADRVDPEIRACIDCRRAR